MEQQNEEEGEPKETAAGTDFDANLTKAPKQARVVSNTASTSPAPGFGGESRLNQEEEDAEEGSLPPPSASAGPTTSSSPQK